MKRNEKGTARANTIIVWFRNDLRVHDHPALASAVRDASYVVPLFIFDDKITQGKRSGSNRNRFLLECVDDLRHSLRKCGADLIVRHGDAAAELQRVCSEISADAIYYTADYTPYAVRREQMVQQTFAATNVAVCSFPGRLIVDNIDKITTKAGTRHKVFTPFWRTWRQVDRRKLMAVPRNMALPQGIAAGRLPTLASLTNAHELSPDVIKGGESEARRRLKVFLDNRIDAYHETNNSMGADGTSRLSAYLHFGCLSPREIELQLTDSDGAQAWHRQLAWRDFYHYVLFYNPDNATKEYQEKYRQLEWGHDQKMLEAWQSGRTGYPIVDAAMRQLQREGWMHNRGRLIVGSFLTKDLWLDWRLGEAYFMKMLIDADHANNNGNWQWIASVGVDPAPIYRRLYNPSSQRDKFDPDGSYVRRYVPELQNVPDKYLSEPWKMPDDVQHQAGCIIDEDYPAPVVDHQTARRAALERFRSV